MSLLLGLETSCDETAAAVVRDGVEVLGQRVAAAQVLQAAATAVGSIDQTKIRDWLHSNEVQTILGPLSWTQTGEPKGQFLLAQWQSGKVQVVGPAEAATTKTVINTKPGWK